MTLFQIHLITAVVSFITAIVSFILLILKRVRIKHFLIFVCKFIVVLMMRIDDVRNNVLKTQALLAQQDFIDNLRKDPDKKLIEWAINTNRNALIKAGMALYTSKPNNSANVNRLIQQLVSNTEVKSIGEISKYLHEEKQKQREALSKFFSKVE